MAINLTGGGAGGQTLVQHCVSLNSGDSMSMSLRQDQSLLCQFAQELLPLSAQACPLGILFLANFEISFPNVFILHII